MLNGKAEVHNISAFVSAMNRLANKEVVQVARKSVRAGTKIVLEETKRNAEAYVASGLMQRSLAIRPLKRRKGRVGFIIGFKNVPEIVAKGSRKNTRWFYPAIVEYGAPGQPPRSPMRRAFDSKKESAKATIAEKARSGIYEAAKRLEVK